MSQARTECEYTALRDKAWAASNSLLTKVNNDLSHNIRAMRTKAPFLKFFDAALTYRHHSSLTKALKKRDGKALVIGSKSMAKPRAANLLSHIDDVRPIIRDLEMQLKRGETP